MEHQLGPHPNSTFTIPVLKYHFTAKFKDGTSYIQNQWDQSELEKTRSCFYDVLQREEQIKTFSITDGKNVFLVDVRDGRFEVNGTSFYMHDRDMPLTNMRLIFYRQRYVSVNYPSMDNEGRETIYCIGWQANDEKGNNIKRIMEID